MSFPLKNSADGVCLQGASAPMMGMVFYSRKAFLPPDSIRQNTRLRFSVVHRIFFGNHLFSFSYFFFLARLFVKVTGAVENQGIW